MDKARRPPSIAARWTAVSFAIVFPTLLTWLYFVALMGDKSGIQPIVAFIGKAIQFSFPAIWVFLILGQEFRLRRPTWSGMAAGLGFGPLVSLAMLALFHWWLSPAGLFAEAAIEVAERVKSFRCDTPLRYAALGVFYSLCHSLLEEYYFRWFVFGQLRELTSLPVAVAASSVAFMAHHVVLLVAYFGWQSPATWLFSAAVAVGGATWAIIYHRSRSLYAVWLSHLLVDAAIFAIGYWLIADELTA